MSDIDNDLCGLANSIAYALEELQAAVDAARKIYSDSRVYDEDGCLDGGWREMGLLAARLDVIRMALESSPPDEIRAACEDAERNIDYISDLADAASY